MEANPEFRLDGEGVNAFYVIQTYSFADGEVEQGINVKVTHEGLILDLYDLESNDLVGTQALLWEDLRERLASEG